MNTWIKNKIIWPLLSFLIFLDSGFKYRVAHVKPVIAYATASNSVKHGNGEYNMKTLFCVRGQFYVHPKHRMVSHTSCFHAGHCSVLSCIYWGPISCVPPCKLTVCKELGGWTELQSGIWSVSVFSPESICLSFALKAEDNEIKKGASHSMFLC